VIVFVSNCELVNFLYQLVSNIDWNRFANRDFADGNTEAADAAVKADGDKPAYVVAGGHVYKLHGDMDHSERKKNFFGFDKADHSVLICTDVASRGLDFKKVEWIVQYDLSSSVKDYVNRVGRTARIATSGSSLCFVMP
jgi:ATP-dependent RNA helicase DDX31/DBP7